jgi:predicted CXXCH cytochrome family protein
MNYNIAFLTRRASGRVTRRNVTLERDVLVFGRSTGSDVHLPDLRVGLSHARLTVTGTQVLLEALGERPVSVNGTQTTSARWSLTDPRSIRVGPYSLTVGEDGADAVKIAIELVDPVPEGAGEARSKDVFALAGALPGQRRMAWILALSILIAFLAIPVAQALRATGALTTADVGPIAAAQMERIIDAADHVRTLVADLPVPIEGWRDTVLGLRIPDGIADDAVAGVRWGMAALSGAMTTLWDAVPLPDGMAESATEGVGRGVAAVSGAITALWDAVPVPDGFQEAVTPRLHAAIGVLERYTRGADRAWDTGTISGVHANIAADCTACHKKPFEAVRDTVCLDCHTAIRDHAAPADLHASRPAQDPFSQGIAMVRAQTGLAPDRCASCHQEHNGRNGLTAAKQTFCADCHDGLAARLPKTTLLDAADFGRHHPQFRPSVHTRTDSTTLARLSLDDRPKEQSGLRFSHAQHLDAVGGVAKMAIELGRAKGYGAALGCADCHQPDAAGALFEPIRMDRHCSACHDLTFALDDGYRRTLPHGQPKEVEALLRDHFIAREVDRLALMTNELTRRRPGERGSVLPPEVQALYVQRVEEATRAALDRAFATQPRGLCYGCHEVSGAARAAATDFAIPPVRLIDRFLPLGRFDHKRHTTAPLTCANCHAATTSHAATDVLLPLIGTAADLGQCGPGGILCSCRSCHAGEDATAATASTCLSCHDYHGGRGGPLMTPARLSMPHP